MSTSAHLEALLPVLLRPSQPKQQQGTHLVDAPLALQQAQHARQALPRALAALPAAWRPGAATCRAVPGEGVGRPLQEGWAGAKHAAVGDGYRAATTAHTLTIP